jgi:TldD protein
MPSLSRRAFIATSSAALTGVGAGFSWPAHAAPRFHVPPFAQQPIETFFPDLVDPEILRRLALSCVDAARQAGATYADVRVSNSRTFAMSLSPVFPIPSSDASVEYAYGVRVQSGGAWGFAFGVDPTADGITRAARSAALMAGAVAKFSASGAPMAPVPVVQGEWATPVEIDPFSVPPDDHCKLLGAYIEAAQRPPGGGLSTTARFRWTNETRVFASTEGSVVTQRLTRSVPGIGLQGYVPLKMLAFLPLADFAPASAGFESVVGDHLQERIKVRAEEAVRLSNYPKRTATVGRFDAVADGSAMGTIFAATLARALEMDRVTGDEMDGEGTTFLASIDSVLGESLFSPELNVTVNRELPAYSAARWDDEGVAIESFPLIERGRVVDYLATRTTAPRLAAWYAKRGRPARAHGVAVSWAPTMAPVSCAPQLTMHPAAHGPTLDEMVAKLDNGILLYGIESSGQISTDPQLAGGAFCPAMMYEVKRGRITSRLEGGTIQFNSTRFWSKITTLGGGSTVQPATHVDYRGETWTPTVVPITAPAARLADVEVMQMGRHF